MALTQEQEEYAAWLLLSKRARRVHGLPLQHSEWAEWKGVTDRTLRRWREKQEFQDHLEQRRLEMAREVTPNSTVTAEQVGGPRNPKDARTKRKQPKAPAVARPEDDPAFDEELSEDEQAYRRARDTLIALAEEGTTEALNLYFKYYGQSFIEAEKSANSELADLSDEELARQVIRLVGEDNVAEALAESAAA